MKIGILTYHFADNYGAVLQAKASYEFMKSIGYEVEIINYASDVMLNGYRLNPLSKSISKTIRKTINSVRRYKQHRKFEAFRERDLNTKTQNSKQVADEIAIDDYDAVVCGSDQVWNINLSNNDETYFLNFVPENIKKIGYAISIGRNDNTDNFKQIVRKYAKRFQGLSFREQNAAHHIANITGDNYSTVVDPVFLLSESVWESYANSVHRVKKDEYILLYQLERNEDLMQRTYELSKQSGLPIKAIHPTCVKLEKGIELLTDIGPQEFLWLIKNAKYVCTNSFHGMAFSIIFNKKTCCAVHKTLGDRNAQLLRLLNVKDTDSIIDFSKLDKAELEKYIISSKEWLQDNLIK